MGTITTKGHAEVPSLGCQPGAMLMSVGCAVLAPPLTWAVQDTWPWWCEHGRAARLIHSATTQAQIQGLELAQPSIYPIYELL